MINNHKQSVTRYHRSAFTLVEMLVSTTLVLLIMSLFAAIFSLASDTVTLQRGIAENDQRARALVPLIRNDFQKRTQRYVLPYYPDEPSTSLTMFGNRDGYLYISTNDPDSYHDDLIQFTVAAKRLQQSQDDTKYYGKAKLLFDKISGTATDLQYTPLQPEGDDDDVRENNVGASTAAEVMLFLRNGKLIRRLSLLRDHQEEEAIQPRVPGKEKLFIDDEGLDEFGNPNPPTEDINNDDVATTVAEGGRFFLVEEIVPNTTPPEVPPTDDFWKHFDYSARAVFDPSLTVPNVTQTSFIGVPALNNEASSGLFPLAKPQNRWGFNPVTGQSREHDGAVTQNFMGRFVHAETSDDFFNWPLARSCDGTGSSIGNGNPMDVENTLLTLPAGTDVITEFNGGPTDHGRGGVRRVEDVLLTNVHEMRIEIWDERLGRYVVPGYGRVNGTLAGELIGDYHIDRCLQVVEVAGSPGTDPTYTYTYGPLASSGVRPHVFDTWHPNVDFDLDAQVDMNEDQPPYIAYDFYPPRQNDVERGPSSPRAPQSFSPSGKIASYWRDSTTSPPTTSSYAVGDVVFARNAVTADYDGWDADNNGSFEWTADRAAAQALVPPVPLPSQGFQIAYRCVVAGNAGVTAPVWPDTPGRQVLDGTVVWEAFDNRRPLQSVRMTIRFKDQPSGQIRQLTMLLPLTDD